MPDGPCSAVSFCEFFRLCLLPLAAGASLELHRPQRIHHCLLLLAAQVHGLPLVPGVEADSGGGQAETALAAQAEAAGTALAGPDPLLLGVLAEVGAGQWWGERLGCGILAVVHCPHPSPTRSQPTCSQPACS